MQIGKLTSTVCLELNLAFEIDQPIYIGATNIRHMQSKHPRDYADYGNYIPLILAYPDYIGRNDNDGSIEYVKTIKSASKHVKVAVRVAGNGKLFVRSMYTLQENRVKNFIRKGTLKKV